jgi:hypothetical protein
VSTFLTLSYADRRGLINTLRTLRKHPGRAVMWGVYALAILGFAFTKTLQPGNRAATPSPFMFAVTDFWVCGLVVAFGVVLATGSARWLGVFTSRAEALVLTRAHVRPVAVAAYLQVRAVISALAQGTVRFAYLVLFGIPAGSSWHALAAQLCFFAAAGAAVASVALPRALARGTTRIAMIAGGIVITVAAVVPLIADIVRLLHLAGFGLLLRYVPAVHPGAVLRALGTGDLRGIAIPLAIAACASAAFALAARDAYPELYTISLANLDWRTRVRSGRRGGRTNDAAATPRAANVRSTAGTRLRGALAFVWVDSLMFSRRVSPWVTALVSAVALAAGAGLATFTQHGNGEIVFGVIVGMVPGLYIAIASTTGVRLAPALRMPLFWLGSVPLSARLAAWTFGAFSRDTVLVALAAVSYAAVSHDTRVPLLIFTGALGLLALTRAVGLAVFAMLPNSLDQRGPAVLLRTLLCFTLIAPPVIMSAIAAFVFGAPFAVTVMTGALIAIAEASILVTLAAWRLAGRVDRLNFA